MTALYNNDVTLWKNSRKAFQARGDGGPELKLIDGHVFRVGEGFVARFESDDDAIEKMTQAGFTFDKESKIFKP